MVTLKQLRRRAAGLIALALTATLFVAGASSAASTSSPAYVTNYQAYTGGTNGAANSKLSPVTIGLVNDQGGTVNSFPFVTTGAQAAVKYVNKYLGGIKGHPLKLSTCFIPTAEEQGQACGLQMVGNKSIHVVVFGSVSVGDASFIAVDQGQVPVIEGNALGSGDQTAKNFFLYNGDSVTTLGGGAAYAKSIHAKKVSVVYPSASATAQADQAITATMQAVGATVTSVAFDPAATDLTAPLVAAGASSADLVVPVAVSTSQCAAAATALKSLGVSNSKVFTFGAFCFTSDVAAALGGSAPHWALSSSQALPTVKSQPDVKAYLAASAKVGLSASAAQQFDASTGWANVLTAVRFINAAGGAKASSAAIAAQAKAFKGPMVLGNPKEACGSDPKNPAVCGSKVRIFQYLGGTNYKALTGWVTGPVLGPPPGG